MERRSKDYFIPREVIIKNILRTRLQVPPQVSLAMGASTQHQHLREGDDVNFECNVAANPRVGGVAWTFEGLALGGDPGGGGGGLTVRNRSLHIRDVRRHHRGRYACLARNSEGEGRSEDCVYQLNLSSVMGSTISVDVCVDAPVCRRDVPTVYGVARHETAEVECSVDADPPDVEFRWSFNSSADGGSWDVVVFTSAETRSVASHVPRSMLDYGTLYCYARNAVGSLAEPCVFRIIPTGKPRRHLSSVTPFDLYLNLISSYYDPLTRHLL
ncbi:hypothetical protein LAZ67_4000194 [Cordylochernes scorpioides]|uniref:Ig-like domain-containing protein n=1 Tax=Cordylochernes scorpioides TaxID=51811 RepID=A0ABY6KEA3_9ARAC|nr:hypothetical protein LAZ67_4000194 [Cordylochernes scorpioides]